MLPLFLLPAAIAAPPTQAEAHALVAGSAVATYDDALAEPLVGGTVLDYARLQGVLRHKTGDGQRLGVQVQIEGTADPVLLDALALYGPTRGVTVEVGLQRTWLSEMFDVLVPIQVLRGRTAPEDLVPGRRAGAQVTFGPRNGAGTHARFGAWAPEGATAGRFSAGILSALVEHRTESDMVLHAAAWSTPGSRAAGWEQGADVAVGYQPDGTRIVAEAAYERTGTDQSSIAATLYGSHRIGDSRLEPAGFVDYRTVDPGAAAILRTAGARAGLTVHLVDRHAMWTTDVGVQTLLGQDGTSATAGSRLMVGF